MAFDLRDCTFFGPALPEPFVKFQLEAELAKRKLIPKATGQDGRVLQDRWDVYRRKLRALGESGGDRRVANHVLEPLAERLGYERFETQAEVITREGPENGGWLFTAADGRKLRAWSMGLGEDLDAPSRRGRAYRFSPARVAQRVLLAAGERVGLLTDGEELRLLLCDPARPDSHVAIRLDRAGGWRAARAMPDSYRLLLALASPDGVDALPDLAEAARLAQSTVTKKLRLQARRAIEGFLQELLDHPGNADIRADWEDQAELARILWREGLILVYRLLFVFKLESSADPARAFSFAATSLWRNTYSPNTALAGMVRLVLDEGADSGGYLESGLRTLWRMFAEGLSSSELEVRPLGGMLFGADATSLLDRLQWGERGVARLLDALLWTPGDGRTERERVHYGALDVEDLGRVYEALLELEPGIATEPMCRLRRAKLEVVVPVAQGGPYRTDVPTTEADEDDETGDEGSDDQDDDGDESPRKSRKKAAGTKTKVQFIEEVPAGRFFLRVGLGRKATGSYYTPHPFVRFLVQETLGPQLAERSPKEDPRPEKILALKVLDPAMGSGHFLVEACRYLGDALYEACRLCDEIAVHDEEQAEKAEDAERAALLAHAFELRKRVEDLPDPEDELVAYLPSRAAEGEESGLSQKKAEALCRRLVAVHCLYGVDKNPLAVELAKLSLWLESYAEGLPLTFMDHRLICGDSLTGPFLEHLLTYPQSGQKMDDLFAQGLTRRLQTTLEGALALVRDLEASVGKDVADLEHKRAAKEKLDSALEPFKTLAAAWSGGVMLGADCDDVGYQALAQAVAERSDSSKVVQGSAALEKMVAQGRESVSFPLEFPELFLCAEDGDGGFDAVVGNPPWDTLTAKSKEWLAGVDIGVLDGNSREFERKKNAILVDETIKRGFEDYLFSFDALKRTNDRLYEYQKVFVHDDLAGRFLDSFRVFMERNAQLTKRRGFTGVIVPSAFHANAGATGVRRLYLEKMALKTCFSFENRKKLFDIHASFKFAAVVAEKSLRRTDEFDCGFYLLTPDVLFRPDDKFLMRYPLQFIKNFDPDYLAMLELSGPASLKQIVTIQTSQTLGQARRQAGISFSTSELNLTKDHQRLSDLPPNWGNLSPADQLQEAILGRLFPVFEGKSVHQYNDCFEGGPTMCAAWGALADRPHWYEAVRYFRLGYRKIASSTNERTAIWSLLPLLAVTAESFPSERIPLERPNVLALKLLATMNSFVADYLLRLRVAATVNLFILDSTPLPSVPKSGMVEAFLAHAALRLTCNHAGYEALWREQLDDVWRESTPKNTWPVLADDSSRWTVRAAVDAVVAEAYGLDRSQYQHILSSFSHKSSPEAPERCLAAFDELKDVGCEAFIQKSDPYWDIRLNESLPRPVIDLPGLERDVDLADEDEGKGPAAGDQDSDSDAGLTKPHVHPTDASAILLSYALAEHNQAGKDATLGSVKCEKLLHMAESYLEVDLGRAPMRLAAGPADVPHLKKVFHRAERRWSAFRAVPRQGRDGASLVPQLGLTSAAGRLDEAFGEYADKARDLVKLFLLMDTERAEIVATLYACWNDLLARGEQPDDVAIIAEFHGWAEGKRRFDADRLAMALAWMREHSLVPTGRATPTRSPVIKAGKKAKSRSARPRTDDSAYEAILALLKEREIISSQDAQQATGLDAAGVRPHLKRLVDEGLAVTEGQRRGMKYRRVSHA